MRAHLAPAALVAGLLASGWGASGCGGSTPRAEAPGKAPAVCSAVASHMLRYAEVLQELDAKGANKEHLASYAGLLEVLVLFEQAANDFGAELATLRVDDAALREDVKRAASASAEASSFAKTEREAIEIHAREIAPLVRETQSAWASLRSICELPKAPADCAQVKTLSSELASATTPDARDQVMARLVALRLPPAAAKSRDRVVTSTQTLLKALSARIAATQGMGKRWLAVEKSVADSFKRVGAMCKDTRLDLSGGFVASEHPDPRKLTVLVKVRPSAGVEEKLAFLARSSSDEGEREFYQARASGAFGSGFLVVRSAASGAAGASGREILVITNRHVVELGDRAALELADGTSLGAAEIVYTDDAHDVAILRPTGTLALTQGFAFASTPAKDQQAVIATGFPGIIGRPSYQTTRGYVSNESFKLDEPPRPETLVQHTAPIDPGSSGGPLTDDRGQVLGVNTLKVTNREAVAFAVPARSILETIRRADLTEAGRASADKRRDGARLACLGFMGELASKQPRMTVLESMVSNQLTGAVGLDAADALADDETFERVWLADSVRAMRIATVVRLRAAMTANGGASSFETCNDMNPEDAKNILSADRVRYRITLANMETREMALRFEQGHWKVAAFDMRAPSPPPSAPKGKPEGAKPKSPGKPKPSKKK